MSPYMFGPDVKASVSLEDLKRIVEGAKFIATMRNTKVDFSKRDESRENLKQMFSKSLFAADYIKSGTVITEDMLVAKKPNIGIDSSKVNSIVGMKATKDIEKNELITMISSDDNLDLEIIKEMEYLKKNYGDDRKTTIMKEEEFKKVNNKQFKAILANDLQQEMYICLSTQSKINCLTPEEFAKFDRETYDLVTSRAVSRLNILDGNKQI